MLCKCIYVHLRPLSGQLPQDKPVYESASGKLWNEYALLPEGANVGLSWLYSTSFFRFFATNSKFSRNSFARSLFGRVKNSSGVAFSTI